MMAIVFGGIFLVVVIWGVVWSIFFEEGEPQRTETGVVGMVAPSSGPGHDQEPLPKRSGHFEADDFSVPVDPPEELPEPPRPQLPAPPLRLPEPPRE